MRGFVKEKRKIGDLKEWPDNPRIMSKETYETLKKSIQKYGLFGSLVINRDNVIIGGNHRWKVLRELYGDDFEIECDVVDLPPEEQKKLNIILNNTEGDFDFEILNKIIQDLASQNVDISDLGFTKLDLEAIQLHLKDDFYNNTESFKEVAGIKSSDKMPTIKDEKLKPVTCPYCGKSFKMERVGRDDLKSKIL